MECRTLLLLCTIAVRTAALAPSFDTFSAAAVGSWTGTQYQWTADGATNGVPCTAVVDEVMRSCGGAVQGVRVDDGPLLNRQDDGFCFFDCGSWTQGPTALAEVAAFDVGLATQSGRVRCVVSVDVAARKGRRVALVERLALGRREEAPLHQDLLALAGPDAEGAQGPHVDRLRLGRKGMRRCPTF